MVLVADYAFGCTLENETPIPIYAITKNAAVEISTNNGAIVLDITKNGNVKITSGYDYNTITLYNTLHHTIKFIILRGIDIF